MRAKFFRFQFIIEILYKLRNFGIRSYKENRKQKFRKSSFQIQQSSKSNSTSKSKIPQNLPKKRMVFYRYIYN